MNLNKKVHDTSKTDVALKAKSAWTDEDLAESHSPI